MEHFAKASEPTAKQISDLDWNELFHAPGMPKFTPDFSNPLSEASNKLGRKWISQQGKGCGPADIKGWSVQQVLLFQDTLLEHANLWGAFSEDMLKAIDKAYDFTSSTNSRLSSSGIPCVLRRGAVDIAPCYCFSHFSRQNEIRSSTLSQSW